jgi:hypothetical protein
MTSTGALAMLPMFGIASTTVFSFGLSFRFDMELFHWQPKCMIDYATATHWYAFADAASNGQTTPGKMPKNHPTMGVRTP